MHTDIPVIMTDSNKKRHRTLTGQHDIHIKFHFNNVMRFFCMPLFVIIDVTFITFIKKNYRFQKGWLRIPELMTKWLNGFFIYSLYYFPHPHGLDDVSEQESHFRGGASYYIVIKNEDKHFLL